MQELLQALAVEFKSHKAGNRDEQKTWYTELWLFQGLLHLLFQFFFSYVAGFITFVFSSLASIKSFGSLFLLLFKNLRPVMSTQRHCAVYGSLVHFTHSYSTPVNEMTISFSKPVSPSKRNS